jgi:hypothetical protein
MADQALVTQQYIELAIQDNPTEALVTQQYIELAIQDNPTEAFVTQQYIEVAVLQKSGVKPIICSVVT